MKSSYKKNSIGLISLLLIVFPIQVAQNCSPFDYDESDMQVALFNPNILGEEELIRFHLQPEITIISTNSDKDYQQNCAEWQAQFSDSISIKDIYTVLYETDPDDFINAYHDQTLLQLIRKNTFIRTLIKKENRPFLNYLYTAFKIQFSHFANDDPWGLKWEDERYKGQYNPQNTWINLIDSIQNTAQNFSPFLKERYGYQLVLNYRYADYPKKCIKAFDYYLSNSNSIVKAWAALHVAHAWFLLKNIPASNLALAMSFDGCESKLDRVVHGFNIEKIDSTLQLARTPKARAAVHALSMMQNPGQGLKAIQTIIKVEPNYHYLPMLIQREVNKIENWLLAPFLLSQKALLDIDWEHKTRKRPKDDEYYFDDDWFWNDNPVNFDIRSKYYRHKNYQKDIQYLRQFRAELLKLIAKPSVKSQQDFLNLAIAHLYFLDLKPKAALSHLNKVSKKAAPIIQSQAHIERILILPQIEGITNKNTQNKLYKSLNWLKENRELIHEYDRTISQLHLYLARLFYQKGVIPVAGLLYAQTKGTIKGDGGNRQLFRKYQKRRSSYYSDIVFFDKYASLQDIDKTFKFYDKPNKTPFENYVCSIEKEGKSNSSKAKATAFKSALLDVQGTIAFRQDKLKAAYRYFSQLPDDYWKETYKFKWYLDNPFPDKTDYYEANKTHIVERMLELKTQQTPDSLALLAEAYFNVSVHGDAWMMFSYGKYPNERKKEINYNEYSYNFQPNAEKYKTVYYEASRAVYYYKKVLNHRKASLEQKATAAFRIGECETIIDRAKAYESDDYTSTRFFSPHHYILFRKFKKAKNYNRLMGCTGFYYDFELKEYTDKEPKEE